LAAVIVELQVVLALADTHSQGLSGRSVNRNWFRSPAHDSGRSLDIVRFVLAFILATHPVYALLHPQNIHGFGEFLGSRGIPVAADVAWAVMFLQIGCSLALGARRFVVPACVGHIFVLGMGILLVHAPKWRTVGLPEGETQQGAEFSLLMIALLLAILWAQWRRPAGDLRRRPDSGRETPSSRQALELVRVASASILIIQPIGGLRDPAGLNDLGLYFSSIGFPFGVPLVWGSMFLQIGSSLALIARRFVVPACLGHVLVLGTGIWLFHAPHWFVIGPDNVVGPGKEGIEYSTLLIACFLSILLAYWPESTS
jgi:putative oxidoreductase